MKKQILKTLALTFAFVTSATIALAVPPPVPQKLGIPDTVFRNFSTNKYELCRGCHTPTATTLTESNQQLITKHHALITQPNGTILSCNNSTGTLPATKATGCHFVTTSPLGVKAMQSPRECFNCHTVSPHHRTTWAAAQDCKHCHGDLIDNPKDGHFIPTSADYAMDTTFGGMTPGTKGRSVTDPKDPTKTIIVQGCEACHQGNAATQPVLFANKDTHHTTGLGQDGSPVGSCSWCHANTGSENNFTIRACEACHGIKSLHSIQGDSPAAANLGKVVASNEDPGFGHVGNNWDCVGCHYSWTGTADVPETTATVPFVSGLSATTFIKGTQNTITLSGQSFVNDGSLGGTYTPVVTLTRGTEVLTITPFSITGTEIKFTLPTTLDTGIYQVHVDKSGTVSNLRTIAIAPPIAIDKATLSGSTVTILGSGFGANPAAEYRQYLGVYVDGVQAKLSGWSDTKIVASSPLFAAGKDAVINTLFGKAAKKMIVGPKKAN